MTNITQQTRNIDRALLSDMLRDDVGTAQLQIKFYYSKDGRSRGILCSVSRILATDTGFVCDVMNRGHNGLVCVLPMDRKPSAKAIAQLLPILEAKFDGIAEIALSSESPDWQSIRALFN